MENEMENTFSPRMRREEYRNKFRFTDEDEKHNVRKSKKAETKTDSLVRLLVLQCVLCMAVAVSVFAVSKLSPNTYERIKNDYSGIMSENMSIGQVWEQIKNAASFAIKPVTQTAAQPIREEKTTENVTVTATNVFETVSDETGESVAVGEIGNGSGGGDVDGNEAASGTSFAPYYVSVSPVIPVKNARITSRFGYRTNPISGNYGFHTGLDLAAAQGTPVAAAFYGEIEETGENDVWGKYVLMRHSDSFETYYCHLSEIYVKRGSVIRQGETVGLVGSTGWSTGPHLHFEVRIGGVRVDPEALLFPEENES